MEGGASASSSQSPPSYDDVFPALPPVESAQRCVTRGLPSYQPTICTENVEIPLTESKYKSTDETVLSDQLSICAYIGKETGVKIELANHNNKSLNVIITGPPAQVARAKLMAVQNLQQQVQRVVNIPSECHRFVIGAGGIKKRDLEARTLVKISVPPLFNKSNEIIITGSPARLDIAEKEIIRSVEYSAQLSKEKISIPQIYHRFVRGPANRVVNEIMEKTNTKIFIPSSRVPNSDITVNGKKNDVAEAVSEITKIYEAHSQRCTTIPCLVPRDKHRLVIGARGIGLTDIFEKTGVVVEPPSNSDSEEFTLRGYPENLGLASTMVFQRASSSVTEKLTAPHRLHKYLIGKKGSALASIQDGYKAVQINFSEAGDEILVKGPSEEVAVVADRLKEKIKDLNVSHHLDFVDVDPKYHSKLLGDGPDSISRFIRLNNLNARLSIASESTKSSNSRHIVIEGREDSVEIIKKTIIKEVEKWENEKIKDVIIEPRIQNLLRSGRAPPISQIEIAFPEVEIRWPSLAYGGGRKQRSSASVGDASSDTAYVVQLCGVRDQVNSAAEKLSKLVKQITEENHEQEIRIFKDCLPRILGAKIVNILKETQTRIKYFPPSDDGSRLVTIIGCQKSVDAAVEQIEKFQRSMVNIQEINVSLPTVLLSKQASNTTTPGARLRSIREQCEGVQLKTDPAQPRKLTISGPLEALEKAKALIDSMCAKMLEHCADSVVFADPKFHGQLIGRNGSNLKRFREKHNVEVLFPDRLESDPNRASEIHIVGAKEAVIKAVEDLKQTVRTMEDETVAIVACEPSISKDLWIYRSTFDYPELKEVKISLPQPPNFSSTGRAGQGTNGYQSGTNKNMDAAIRIVGPKGCVEGAQQCIVKIIEEIKSQVVVKHPVTEIGQYYALNRLRPTMPDIQRNHNVLISLKLSRDGFREGEDKRTIYGHIVLTGDAGRIDNALKTEILPLLPVTEAVAFSRDFYRKLFVANTPPQQRRAVPQRGGKRSQHEALRNAVVAAHAAENGESVPETRIKALQNKFNVQISVPPITQRGADQITIRGVPDAVEACKAELEALEAQLQAEEADRQARNYEEILNIEERYLNRVMLGEKERLFKQYGVNVFIRGRDAASLPTVPEAFNGEEEFAQGPSTSTDITEERYAGYRLVSCINVPVILRGYKEKVELARGELEELVNKLKSFVCIELHIPSEAHSRLIGSRRSNIQRVETTYDVDVEFPPRGAGGAASRVVLVMGCPDNVDNACDELINKANDICAQLEDSGESLKRQNGHDKQAAPQEPPSQGDFVVVGAPWDRNDKVKVSSDN